MSDTLNHSRLFQTYEFVLADSQLFEDFAIVLSQQGRGTPELPRVGGQLIGRSSIYEVTRRGMFKLLEIVAGLELLHFKHRVEVGDRSYRQARFGRHLE